MISIKADVDKAIKQLTKLEKKTVRAGLRKGTRAAANVFKKEIKKNAPKESGDLKRAIRVRKIPGRKVIGHRVEINVAHAAPLEFGTKYITENPFIRESFDKQIDKALKEVAVVIYSEIRKASHGS